MVDVAAFFNWPNGWNIIQTRIGIFTDSCSIDDFAGLF
jgi:hypothetical protein